MSLPQVAECSNHIPRPIVKQYTAVACRSGVGTILREIWKDTVTSQWSKSLVKVSSSACTIFDIANVVGNQGMYLGNFFLDDIISMGSGPSFQVPYCIELDRWYRAA